MARGSIPLDFFVCRLLPEIDKAVSGKWRHRRELRLIVDFGLVQEKSDGNYGLTNRGIATLKQIEKHNPLAQKILSVHSGGVVQGSQLMPAAGRCTRSPTSDKGVES